MVIKDSDSNSQLVIQQNFSYYDKIAFQSANILNANNSNSLTRTKVKPVFCKLVASGIVLDFGGGTGRDLEWLTGNGYKIIFCEPSVNMRERAIALNYKNVEVLENKASDFTMWETSSPFVEKVDAILANFA